MFRVGKRYHRMYVINWLVVEESVPNLTVYKSPGNLIKMEVLIQQVWGDPRASFLTNSQVMGLLLVCGHLE
jgi:hypothetical protein